MAGHTNTFESDVFGDVLRNVEIAGTEETVMYGGDRRFELLRDVFGDLDEIAVVGWSSQGPAQAQNLRDSLGAAGLDTEVTIGLREGSDSRPKAEALYFRVGTPEEVIRRAGMSILLIEDAALVHDGQRYINEAPKDATIGFSHGFFLGHLEATGQRLRDDIGVVGVCPKGMGPSVRRLYEQGSGINASFAVEQGDEKHRERALAWAYALGAPYTFQTTLGKEWRSDVFGERAILLGGVHGLVESMYTWKREQNMGGEQAYLEVVESLVGPISKTISREGLRGVFEGLEGSDRERFANAYNAAYPQMRHLINKLYVDVSSGRELAEVVSDNEHKVPMTQVDGTTMWRDGEKVRSSMDAETRGQRAGIDPEVAGVYVAAMMAQIDVLRANGHDWSEVVNESVIEAVDSLNPYMRAQGVAYMVDNCSVTARRGSRKWAPHFQAVMSQAVLPVVDGVRDGESHDYFRDFLNHDVHAALRSLGRMRPPIDISVAA